ncbi:2'-5' RNA ligase family protein [Romboutsia sp. Marseille-P6047]
MRYVIVSVVKGDGGKFNNELRKDIFENLSVKSSKLPAHFTIKSPFECEDISILDKELTEFTNLHSVSNYKLNGYDSFDNRVIFMKVIMSNKGKKIHDDLIDTLSSIPYIKFDEKDGKNKIFHVTVSSKKIKNRFNEL